MEELERLRREMDHIDSKIAELFAQRMETAQKIADYKAANGLPITDAKRENEVILRNSERLPEEFRGYYRRVQTEMMAVSRDSQRTHLDTHDAIWIQSRDGAYPIYCGRGLLKSAAELFHINSRVAIITDDGLPEEYIQTLSGIYPDASVFRIPQGEESKTPETVISLAEKLLLSGFGRNDALIAFGGGVVGDITGLLAACYMRGIRFYAIPTTLLSQVDSCIGGKNAVNCAEIKNAFGSFYAPSAVLVDADLLKTLPSRQTANGMAEIIKIAATHDIALFSYIESTGDMTNDTVLDHLIQRALMLKRQVVEADENDRGDRAVLNFGHTLGHAIEMTTDRGLLHGECVALGMIRFCAPEPRSRIAGVLQKAGLITDIPFDSDAAWRAVVHDKKVIGNGHCRIVYLHNIGNAEILEISSKELKNLITARE